MTVCSSPSFIRDIYLVLVWKGLDQWVGLSLLNSYDRHCHHSSNICHYYRSKGKVCNSSFSSEYSIFLAQFESMDFPPGIKAPTSTNLKNDSDTPWSYLENLPQRMLWQPHPLFVDLPFFYVPVYEFYAPKDVKKFPWLRPSSQKNQNNAAAEPIVANSGNDKNEILRRFQLFKQFDIVEDYSDHYYASDGFTAMQVTRFWWCLLFSVSSLKHF